ncbi:MAG: DUF4919 domain-containing protein [Flavobacteriales bacterium]|nr:DUF4919 domain-containing protein [Flavobacteriales bacterium]
MALPKHLRLVTILCPALLLAAHPLSAQDRDLEEARGYMEQDACEEASAAAARSLARQQGAEAHWIIGHCLLERDALDSALWHLTQAVGMDSAHVDAVFDLGRAHQYLGDAEAAIGRFRAYTALQPGKIRGRIQEALVHMRLLDDVERTVDILSECLKEHPSNAVAQYYMAVAQNKLGNHDKAMEWAGRGEQDHSDDPDFPALKGGWAMREEQWKDAADAYRKAHAISRSTRHGQSAAYCTIMANTHTDAWHRSENGDLRFNHIGAEHMARMDEQLTEEGGPYHYPTLQALFDSGPESLSLDRMFMFYYGQHTHPEYSPYSDDIDDILRPLFDKEKYKQVMAESEKHLAKHPGCLKALRALAVASRHTEGSAAASLRHLLRYEGLLQGILASGSGGTPEDAIIVASVSDEYVLLGYMGLQMHSQSLTGSGGHKLDLMACKDGDGVERKVYFEISKPFASMAKMFSDPGSQKSTRKGGKKKQGK